MGIKERIVTTRDRVRTVRNAYSLINSAFNEFGELVDLEKQIQKEIRERARAAGISEKQQKINEMAEALLEAGRKLEAENPHQEWTMSQAAQLAHASNDEKRGRQTLWGGIYPNLIDTTARVLERKGLILKRERVVPVEKGEARIVSYRVTPQEPTGSLPSPSSRRNT